MEMNFFETKTFDLWAKAMMTVVLNTTCMYLLSKCFGLFDFNLVRSFLISWVWFLLFYKNELFEVVDEWNDLRKKEKR
ncbi:hypothetical protein CG477_022940 (plasmid) [Bacillus cytotoxicus]|uniref:hypothetical protein n=1 Tax=Bacillus cereus group TaxID=86661 RepID=UPI000B979487|nr:MULTISPECIES: hypothetical protein [Bacillus cereus group]AWC31030.1 hypothetical protein CG483_022700 [Bacillus cytotoxicus]AWC35022.1 hypothetical protein CG482_022445 [Bacillus cytotoxicus]AWC39060.1 hypothetical protein CG481_022445 [Bacillus cytotoxicus]AWC55169.1 hypothetical protein CG477_022940 [Bacillus cytotoxicus]AWC59242.1 hypothetical protein CG476_022740 [Bacillus cytotoxicus]